MAVWPIGWISICRQTIEIRFVELRNSLSTQVYSFYFEKKVNQKRNYYFWSKFLIWIHRIIIIPIPIHMITCYAWWIHENYSEQFGYPRNHLNRWWSARLPCLGYLADVMLLHCNGSDSEVTILTIPKPRIFAHNSALTWNHLTFNRLSTFDAIIHAKRQMRRWGQREWRWHSIPIHQPVWKFRILLTIKLMFFFK